MTSRKSSCGGNDAGSSSLSLSPSLSLFIPPSRNSSETGLDPRLPAVCPLFNFHFRKRPTVTPLPSPPECLLFSKETYGPRSRISVSCPKQVLPQVYEDSVSGPSTRTEMPGNRTKWYLAGLSDTEKVSQERSLLR